MPALFSKELVWGAAIGAGITGLVVIGYQCIMNRGTPTSTNKEKAMTDKDIDARMKHNWLLNKLDGLITEDSLESIKQIARTYLEPKIVAKIKTMNDLLSHLEVKGVIDIGQYEKLIEIMENAEIRIGIEDIKKTAEAIQNIVQSNVTSQELSEMPSLDARSDQPSEADHYDALIMHDDSAQTNTMVYKYRDHLEKDLEVEDVRVQLIGDIGIGQSQFNMMEDVLDRYRYIFVFLTPNFTEDTLTHFKTQMSLMQSLQDPHKKGRIIPVWTAKEKEKTKNYPWELVILGGVHYWRFNDDNYKMMYIKSMQKLIWTGRKLF